MSDTTTTSTPTPTQYAPGAPSWVDVSGPDIPAAKAFYTGLFGWQAIDLPAEAGGYVMFSLDGAIVAAVGPTQGDDQPAAWSVYFSTEDADETSRKVETAGGKVVWAASDVMDQGRMAIFQDPTGALFSVWQPKTMPGLGKAYEANTFGWAELNAEGVAKTEAFYAAVFGWGAHKTGGTGGVPPYIEWQVGGKSIGGAMDLAATPGMEGVSPHWLVYFSVTDIDASTKKVAALGGVVHTEPKEYPGGRFAVVGDPAGAHFALMQPSGG